MNLRNLTRLELPMTLSLALLPALTNAAENGTWSSQIKESSYAITDANCSYGGLHDASAMVNEFNASKHSVWMAPIGPISTVTSFTTRCNWKNLARVSQNWNASGTSCTGCNPIVYGVMNNEELALTNGLDSLASYAAELNTLATTLSGPTPVRMGLSVDDAQGLFRTTLKPAAPHSLVDFESTYTRIKTDSPNVEISPYFEAAIAMSLAGDTYRLGIPADPASDTSYRFHPGESVSLTFNWKSGLGTGLPNLPDTARIEFPLADLYLNTDATRNLQVVVQTSSDGGATWSPPSKIIDLLDSGTPGTRIHHVSYRLSNAERTAMLAALFKMQITLKNSGSRFAAPNLNKLILIGSPIIDITRPTTLLSGGGTPRRVSFSKLMRTFPGIYTLTPNLSSTASPHALGEATPASEKLLDQATATRRIDGIFFKLDSNPAAFDSKTEALVAENICLAPKSLSLPCRSVTWGSSLQGTATLSAETEAKRYIATLPYVSGSVSYNYPLDLAAPANGVLAARVSSSGIANSLGVFLWPYDTRGVDGYTRRWEWTVPLDYPAGQPSTLTWGPIPRPGSTSGRSAPPTNSCTLTDSTSGTAIPVWRFSLEGTLSGSHPETNLKNSAGLSTTFIPVPGETLTLQLAPLNVSIGNTLCYAEGFITLPSGYTPSSGAFLSGLSDTVSASTNANDLFSCVRYLFQNPTVSSFSAIPAGICPP